jgi:hypothetical protein
MRVIVHSPQAGLVGTGVSRRGRAVDNSYVAAGGGPGAAQPTPPLQSFDSNPSEAKAVPGGT